VIGRNVALPALLLIFVAAMCVSAEAQGQSATTTKKSPSTPSGAHKSAGKSSAKKGKKGSRRQPGQKAPTTDRISEIQTALSKDGSFSGAPNGKWDDSTVDAVKKFQVGHGLNPTGRLDAPTLQKLGLGSTTAGVAAPTPPPGAVSRLTSSMFNSVNYPADDQQ
jgi:peptidoglycan hydrolase-like protein with peptidoglycan-binding domain